MNILQAYIKIFGKLFIHIIGLPGSNSDKIAKELADDLDITFFDIKDYMHTKYPEVVLPNSTKIKNKYDVSIIDIKTLTHDIDSFIHKGVVLSSYGLFSDKFKIKPELQILLDISKKYAIKNIMDSNSNFDIRQETFLFNHYLIPYIDDLKKNEKINKFINLKGDQKKETDMIWDYIMWFFDNKVYSDEAKTIVAQTIPIGVPTIEEKKNLGKYDVTRKKLAPPTKFPYSKPQKSYIPKPANNQKKITNDNVTINKTITNDTSNITLKNKNNNLSISIDSNKINHKTKDTESNDNKTSVPIDPKYDISLETNNIPDDYDEIEDNYKKITSDSIDSPSTLFVKDDSVKPKKHSKTKKNNKENELTITVTHPNQSKQHEEQNSEESDLLKAVKQIASDDEKLKKNKRQEEKKKKLLEEKQRREQEKKKKLMEEKKRREEEQRKSEQEKKKKLMEEKKRREEEQRKSEQEKKKKLMEEKKRREEEQRKSEQEKKKKLMEEKKRREEEQRKSEQEKKKKLMEEKIRREQEKKKKLMEEKIRREQEKKKKLMEEKIRREQEKKKKLMEEKIRREEEKKKKLMEEKIRREQEKKKKLMEDKKKREEEKNRRKQEKKKKLMEDKKKREEEKTDSEDNELTITISHPNLPKESSEESELLKAVRRNDNSKINNKPESNKKEDTAKKTLTASEVLSGWE